MKLLQDEVGEVKCGGRGDVVKVCEEEDEMEEKEEEMDLYVLVHIG